MTFELVHCDDCGRDYAQTVFDGVDRHRVSHPQARIVYDGHHRVELCLVADRRCKFGWPGCCDECPHSRVRMNESRYWEPEHYRRNRRWNRKHGLVAEVPA